MWSHLSSQAFLRALNALILAAGVKISPENLNNSVMIFGVIATVINGWEGRTKQAVATNMAAGQSATIAQAPKPQ